MEDPPAGPAAPDGDDEHQMPRWVKGFIVAAVAAVVLVAVALAVDSGRHGPSRHLPGGEPATQTPGGHTPPFDHG